MTPLLCSGANFPSMFWENAFVYNTPVYISRGCCVGGPVTNLGVCYASSSSGITMAGLLGLTSAIIVALVFA